FIRISAHIFFSFPDWEPLGCYKDSKVRTMPHYFDTVRFNASNPDFYDMFLQCQVKAEKHNYTYFGIQYMKECWGSPNARLTYDTQGCADNCRRRADGYGIGGHWSNYVYRVKEEQCTVDHLLKFVTDLLPAGSVEINNQFIGALRQVVKAIETAKGMPTNVRLDKTNLIERIKKSVVHKGLTYARTMLGFLLQKQLYCHLTGDTIIKEIKDALGEDKFKDFLAVDGDVSLIFTMDTTGSMTQEIPQAKALAKALNDYKRRGKVEYILSTFNDPDCGPVKTFTKTEKLKFDAAIDRLDAFGGGDCQEPAFEGIINAIDHGAPFPSSPMFVFTDSPSKIKGHNTGDAAIGLALDHMMHINFFFSRYGCSNPRRDSDFGHAMEDTGGIELFFPTPLSFHRADGFVKADLDGTAIISVGRTMGGSGGMKVAPPRIEFPVDRTIRRLIVSVTAASNDAGVGLVDSNGKVLSNALSMFEGKLWVVENPIKGTWALIIRSDVQGLSYTIKASNTFNIDFDHVFVRTVQSSGQQVHISNPLRGEKARAKIIIPQMSRLDKTTLRLHLLDKYGTTISPLTLDDDEVSFDLPVTSSFRIRLTGNTTDGDRFMRTSPNIRSLTAVIRIQILQDLLNIKRGRISYFRAMIDYASAEPRLFKLVGSSFTRGIKLTMRRTVRVTRSRPGYIPVFVVTRYKVPVGTVAKIQITAKSSDVSINLLASLIVT
ncbi:hypothetical protein QZH41_014496, partial [Actinostola sp. cb2023]